MQEIKLPKRGQAMEEGLIHEWAVKEGDQVSTGKVILEFETGKTTAEIEADQNGILLKKLVEPGETVSIGTTLGYIGTEDEVDDLPTIEDEDTQAVTEAAKSTTTAGEDATTPKNDTGSTEAASTDSTAVSEVDIEHNEDVPPVRASPTARKAARSHGVDIEAVGAALDVMQVRPDHVEQYVSEADDKFTVEQGHGKETAPAVETRGSPSARRIADQEDIAITTVGEQLGTDRVRMADINDYMTRQAEFASTKDTTAEITTEPEHGQRTLHDSISITGGRKVMFNRMQQVSSEYGSTTTITRVDVTDLMDLLGSLKEPWREQHDVSPSLTAFVIRGVAESLPKYRMLNAEIIESNDSEKPSEIHQFEDINIGLAVDTEQGLLVPTLYDADEVTVAGLGQQVADLATQARNQSLEYEQQQNATFTVSNAGTFGAYINTPQINPPQTGILGVCTVNEEPGISDGEIVPRKFLHLSLTYDHRVVEGSTAVQFLRSVKQRLEEPESLLQ